MSLSIFKNSFFHLDHLQKSNRFFVDLNLWSPYEGRFLSLYNEPALSVEAPNLRTVTEEFKFQNIPIDIPIKRTASAPLLIRFYMRESLNIYKTISALVKQYGGDPYFGSGNLSRPSSFGQSSLYNTAIRWNTAYIKLVSDVNNQIINSINYISVYPYAILPVGLNSADDTQPATLTVQFSYAYAKSSNETNLDGAFY